MFNGSLLEVIGTFAVVTIVCKAVSVIVNGGFVGFVSWLAKLARGLPGVDMLLESLIRNEVVGFVQQLYHKDTSSRSDQLPIPEHGIPHDKIMEELKEIKGAEADVGQKVFAYKYILDPEGTMQGLQEHAIMSFTDKHEVSSNHQKLAETTQAMFMNENALNPIAFPSLRKFELECVAMTAWMLNGGSTACGFLTSGGTESILMAVKTYRDMARKYKPYIGSPEILAPISIHPAFEKAAAYFGLKVVHTKLNQHYEADVSALEQAITPNTVMIAASAPSYPHGIMDPIESIAQLAKKYRIPFHVDACYGGFMLPWLEKLGKDVPKFDFRCEGVTSMSADLHKFGYSPKGASAVVYINEEIRRFQLFAYTSWPGGLFGSTTMAGTRSGGAMAAAWVSLKHLGQNGYMDLAEKLYNSTHTLINGCNSIKGIEVIGKPVMNCFAIKSADPSLRILVVADEMEKKGWRMERQQLPDSIHFSILPQHIGQEEKLLSDLSNACNKSLGRVAEAGESAAMYGMIGKIPDQTIVDDFVKEYFSKVYM